MLPVLIEPMNGGYRATVAGFPNLSVHAAIVVASESLKGRLHAIRQADAGKGRARLEVAYSDFLKTLKGLASYELLPYELTADLLFQS